MSHDISRGNLSNNRQYWSYFLALLTDHFSCFGKYAFKVSLIVLHVCLFRTLLMFHRNNTGSERQASRQLFYLKCKRFYYGSRGKLKKKNFACPPNKEVQGTPIMSLRPPDSIVSIFKSVTHNKIAYAWMNPVGSILQPPTLLHFIDIWQKIFGGKK
jgi:hypothetical protein